MLHARMKFLPAFIVFAMILFAAPTFAQTESTSTDDTDVLTEDIIQTEDGDTVVIDDTYEDVDVEQVDEIPTGLGLWWRGVKERVAVTFTFDPVEKAEKELRFAEERRQIFE